MLHPRDDGMSTETPIRLKVPQQDLQAVSLFASSGDAAKAWAQGLPVANPLVVASQLTQALDEINRCKLHPEQRFEILDALQGNLLVATSNLSRRFLNQPLVMAEELRRQTELVSELYSLTTVAYTIVAVETLRERDSIRGMNPARLMCQALLRAIEYSNRKLLLSFQLHQPVDINGWLTLHQLYALAERQALADIPLPGADGESTSISKRYLVALMLGCCKPNQLRQVDLATTYQILLAWGNLVRIVRGEDPDALFVVDLDRDQPPLYAALYRDGGSPQCRRVNTSALVSHMQNLLQLNDRASRGGIPLDDDTRVATGLLSHLVDALGRMSVRNFARKPVTGPLAVSFGLSAAHYHAAGDHSFQALLHGSGYIPPVLDRVATNPFMTGAQSSSNKRDKWSQANPEEDFLRASSGGEAEEELEHQVQLDARTAHAIYEDGPELPEEPNYPVYELNMVNASPGGYCLEWSELLPTDIKTGELVSVQEEPDGQWVLAVIRWISQLPRKRTLLGLELLSPAARPYGAVIRNKTGEESEPQRVLLLPEIPLVGQPNTLVTPRAGFHEHQKITLITNAERLTVQLLRQIAVTGSFARFDFRRIRLLGDVIAEEKGGPLDASYDSMWSRL